MSEVPIRRSTRTQSVKPSYTEDTNDHNDDKNKPPRSSRRVTRNPKKETTDGSTPTPAHVPVVTKSCEELREEIPLIRASLGASPKPFALLLLGPAGAGKSTIFKNIFPENIDYDYYNLDDYQEKLLELNGLLKKVNNSYEDSTSNKIKEIIGEETTPSYDEKQIALTNIRSIIGKMMGLSKRCISEDFENMIRNKHNIVIDRPGDKLYATTKDSIKSQINILKNKGYTIYTVVVYASLKTVLKRNASRARRLPNHVIIDIWKNLMNNLSSYQSMFKDNFILIDNDNDDSDSTFTINDLDPAVNIKYREGVYNEIKSIYDNPIIQDILKNKKTITEARVQFQTKLFNEENLMKILTSKMKDLFVKKA
jgi:predicted kinase